MSIQVPYSVSVDYLSPFTPYCNSVIADNGGQSTVGNDGFEGSVGENTVHSETGYASAPESSDVLTLDSGSSCNQSVVWSDFVVIVDSDGVM